MAFDGEGVATCTRRPSSVKPSGRRDDSIARLSRVRLNPPWSAGTRAPSLTGTFRPRGCVGMRLISVRDAEVAGSNPAFPTGKRAGQGVFAYSGTRQLAAADHRRTTFIAVVGRVVGGRERSWRRSAGPTALVAVRRHERDRHLRDGRAAGCCRYGWRGLTQQMQKGWPAGSA